MKKITKIEAAGVKSNKKLRVAAYARVSTDSDEQLVSLDTQKNHYERYIKARPEWEYAGLYYDEGVTGTKLAKRDGLLRLLADCDKGMIDYIIVKSISRFSRNTVDSIEIVRKLCQDGIYIYFEKENIDSEMLKRGNDEGTIERLDEIDTLLEKNMDRRQQIMQFFTKGLLDPAVYAEENDALADEERRLTSEKELLSGQMSGSHEQQEALTRLLKYTAKGRTITEFDDELFTEHVDHVVIYKRTEIGFAMKCGPIFRERI